MVTKEVVLGEMVQRWKGRYAAVQRVRGMRDGTESVDWMFDFHQPGIKNSSYPIAVHCWALSILMFIVGHESQVDW